MGGWIKPEFARDDFGPGVRSVVVASAALQPNTVVLVDDDGTAATASAGAPAFGQKLAVCVDSATVAEDDDATVAFSGDVDVECVAAFSAGVPVKVFSSGKIGPALSQDNVLVSVQSTTGLSFANQPANDTIEVVSSSASDVQYLDLYGTTNGGVVVVKERILLTGTTPVTTVKTDWGVLLGAIVPNGLGSAAVGTITIREGSGNATIITIAPGARSSGVVTISSASSKAYGKAPVISAAGASTKVVGVVGYGLDNSTVVMEAVTLAGKRLIPFSTPLATFTYLLVGDVASSTTVNLVNGAVHDVSEVIGVAVEAGIAGEVAKISLAPKSSQSILDGSEALHEYSVTLTAAQVISSFSAPVSLLPAPPSGYSYFIEKVKSFWDYGSAVVVAGSMTTSGIGFPTTGVIYAACPALTVFTTAADSTSVFRAASHRLVNEGLEYISNADATSGGTGSTLTLKIWYRLIAIS